MTLPVTHSIVAPEALRALIARDYALGEPLRCALFRAWTNDVYAVTTAEGDYFLKVYGSAWRTRAAVAYELDLLAHLAARGVAVAPAIARRDGATLGTLPAPEGERCAVLFAAAPGAKPQPPFSADLYRRFGKATAQIHAASDDFASPHPRAPLDLAALIDRPLRTALPHLAHRPNDAAYLRDLAARTRVRLVALVAERLDWGVCHGDLSLDNVHIGLDGGIAFYDFDSGGPGWRASDLYGVYQYGLDKSELWEAFLDGYRAVRPFGATDRAALPHFVVAQHLWMIGHEAGVSATRVGLCLMDDPYFDRKLALLRRWDAEQLR